jgi:mono/diheme cytochrome c family protein
MKQLAAFVILAGLASGVHAANIDNGKALHAAKCMGCHDNSIYTRPDSIIRSYGSLQNRVKFCDVAAQAHFTEDQINDIVAYLNSAFYKFKQP